MSKAVQDWEEERLNTAVTEAAKPFLLNDGQDSIEPNSFIYVVASL
ncbi:MAG: hypothetical protein AAF708_03015 [Deinococcota bacterium]